MSPLLLFAIVIAGLWMFSGFIPGLKCECGQKSAPWFGPRHEKAWVMWTAAIWFLLISFAGAYFAESLYICVFNGMVGTFLIREVWEHRRLARNGKKELVKL